MHLKLGIAMGLLMALAACAVLPESVARIGWADQWGDRGAGVLARDHHWCADAVENRRSQMTECMARRGWVVRP